MDKFQASAPTQDFSPGQTESYVRTSGKDGEWMSIQKASEATGLHEKTIRRYIKSKKFRSKRLGSNTNSPLLVYITTESLKAVYAEVTLQVEDDLEEAEDSEISDFEGQEQVSGARPETDSQHATDIENIFKAMTQQFAEKLDQQTQLIYDLRNEVVEKEKQLLLIPDLQKQAEEKIETERLALKEKLEQVEAELAQVKAEKEELLTKKRTWWQWFMGAGN